MAKASKIAARLSDHLSWSQQSLNLIGLISTVLMLLHFFACALGIVTTFPESPADTWLARFGFCAPLDEAHSLLQDASAWQVHSILKSILDEASLAMARPDLLPDAKGTTAVDGFGSQTEFVCMEHALRCESHGAPPRSPPPPPTRELTRLAHTAYIPYCQRLPCSSTALRRFCLLTIGRGPPLRASSPLALRVPAPHARSQMWPACSGASTCSPAASLWLWKGPSLPTATGPTTRRA